MSIDYTALIKNAKDIPVLSTGIDSSVTSESTFPVKEHPSLLTHTGKTTNTPLNNTLSARHIKVPANPKDPHYADRHTLASIKKNALTLCSIPQKAIHYLHIIHALYVALSLVILLLYNN